MSWEARVSSLLAETDCGVARAKRLNMTNIPCKVDLQLDRISTENAMFDEHLLGTQQRCPTCLGLPHCNMAAEKLAAISSQLHSQTKIVELLTQSVNRLKQEKEFQQQRISNLEEDVQRLQNSLYSNLETLLRRIDELKSEHRKQPQKVFHQPHGDCESRLHPHFSSPQEMKESSEKLLRQDYVSMRKELEQLKHKVNQQEEELLNQMSAANEIKRTQSRYCTVLEDLLSNHKTQSYSLDQPRMEMKSTQQELSHIRSTVADLKEQVKSLFLKEMLSAEPIEKDRIHWTLCTLGPVVCCLVPSIVLVQEGVKCHYITIAAVSPSERSKSLLREAEGFSPSSGEDSSSELSLKDLSSDELSSIIEIKVPEEPKDISTLCFELEESNAGEEAGNMLDADDDLSSELSDSLPELHLSDL
ncbi:spindle assembly abnormal protein 6 homolog isoform X3 [Struthio camelus]|uniref:spindle assembly abnormal protein 6 homolog isoform X3 n=1 Tax=Struthio camelus TaxID=8801 RepID=UPI003603D38D